MSTFSPAPITVQTFVNDPVLVQRTIESLVMKNLIGGQLLGGRVDVTGSGAAQFEGEASIFAADDAELIDELAEYPLTADVDAAPSVFTVGKYGLATDIPDTVIKRNRMDVVQRKLQRIANRIVFGFNSRVLSAIASASIPTSPAIETWDTPYTAAGPNADPLLDVLLAKAEMASTQLGFSPSLLVLRSAPWAYLSAKKVEIPGLTVLASDDLPSGTDALLVDPQNLGSIMWEDQGGGYAGDASDVNGAQSKVFRLEKQDGVRIQVRKTQEPVVTEARAAVEITGVL